MISWKLIVSDIVLLSTKCNHFNYYKILQFPLPPSLSLSAYLMYSFNQFWLDANPENIMAFPRVKESFLSQLKQRLKQRPLVINLSLDPGSSD